MNQLKGIMSAVNNKKGIQMAHKGIAASFLGMLVMACSACGGGGGGGGNSPAAAVANAAVKSVAIDAYGDSTVVGCTAQAGASATAACPVAGYVATPNNEESTLQSLLQQRFGTSVTVQNMGVAGTTLADLLNGTNGVAIPWAQRMAQSKAQIVTIKDGINDAYEVGMTPELFGQQLAQAISLAKAAGKVVILETSNPITTDHNDLLATLVAVEIVTAKSLGVQVVDHYNHFLALPNWAQYISDGSVHPTDAGYEIQGQFSALTVAPIVISSLAS